MTDASDGITHIPDGFKSGFIAIIGAPNAGKSTLLNQLLGTKVAITTPKPQTTRRPIRGILTTERYQLVFVDTPGIHDSTRTLNQVLVGWAKQVLSDVDVVLWVMDVAKVDQHHGFILGLIKNIKKPVILLLNKIDLIAKDRLLPIIGDMHQRFDFASIIPISARFNNGLELVIEAVLKFISVGPLFYDADAISDQTRDLLAAEIIREKIFLLTHEDIPYATAVDVEDFKEDLERGQVSIQATIYVEKPSQKAILVGADASMIKRIKKLVKSELETHWGMKVSLDLWVKVHKKWSRDERFLKRIGLIEK